jgi:periplasmic protein TonB
MGDRRNRAFHYAVLLSIVVHAVVLLASPSLREAARRIVWPEPIVARLVEPPAPPAPPAAEPIAPPRVEKPPPVTKPAAKPTVKPVPPAEPAPVAKAAPEAPPQPEAAAPPAAAPAPATPVPPAPAATVARPGADVDADTVGRYRMLVIDAARKLKRYPRAARDNNWEGRASVRVSFGVDGRRSSVAVVRSSGHEILDREALDTVTRAEVPVPSGLRGKEFAFEIEVVFNLGDGG